MLSFLILLLPSALAFYFFWKKEFNAISVVFTGIITAVLLCAIKVFFTYSHRVIPYSFSENFVYFLVNQTLVPVFVIFLLYSLLVKKDFKEKVNDFFPLITSFYIVYLPYVVISSTSSVYSGYSLFVKPILFLSMILECSISIYYFYENVVAKRYLVAIINTILFVAYVILAAVIDSLYVINYKFTVVLISSILYALFPIGYLIFLYIRSFFDK